MKTMGLKAGITGHNLLSILWN